MTASEAAADAEPDGEAVLRTDGLTKRFGGLVAVDEVDLRIDQGDIRCLIGPNGAGKSTLLKLLMGRLDPSEGTVFYRGEDVTDLSQHDRVRQGMSMKFQVPAVYGDLSVRQNLHISLQQRIENDIDARIDERLESFGLFEEADTRADDLAHGQQQWLEIAMASALDPDLLLLDEPAAGMSTRETERTAELVHQLNDQGITLLVIEHDIDFVRSIAQSVTVLHQGEVFAEGTIEEIEENPDVRRIYLGEGYE
ncbi:ABC transporter ATP-binding protein [Haloplanus salinus]|uniref:ABC transporter ATP-binding protein n=1 Tax=Haloplanus salinus TaxID=1126245 RepID=A0A368N5Y4_9EURY|nr:ABC transporter ATP-binding protein [Haloplanus salinus]RCU45958.1 ABC transporter ATP-binding protein [Haloplanus salinus]